MDINNNETTAQMKLHAEKQTSVSFQTDKNMIKLAAPTDYEPSKRFMVPKDAQYSKMYVKIIFRFFKLFHSTIFLF